MITNKTFLAKGHRAFVYTAEYKGVKIAVKEKRPDSDANHILQEYKLLKTLNMHHIGPRVIFSGEDYFGMELINGIRITTFINEGSRDSILVVLEKVLGQLRKLDELRINKTEMTNPYKHILVIYPKIKLIDFERARYSEKPGNITQFCSFLSSRSVSQILARKRIFIIKDKLQKLCMDYKKNYSEEKYLKISDLILQKSLQERIYYAASKIPKGKVASYAGIARSLNSKAFRFIGQAMSRNEFWPIVPCHRVISNDGSLGGFGGGMKKKIQLLKSENIAIIKNHIDKKYFIKL